MTPGRIDIARRAVERTVTAVAAGHLGVPRSEVAVRLADDRGQLAVTITGAIHTGRENRILTFTNQARTAIGADVTRLTGSAVSSVSLRLTRAITTEGRRVR